MIVYSFIVTGVILGIVFILCMVWSMLLVFQDGESSDHSTAMDSLPETAAPMQVPFQQSNTPMHQPIMQSVPPLPTYISNPPPLIAGTNQFCSNTPPDLPPPPPYAGSTWN